MLKNVKNFHSRTGIKSEKRKIFKNFYDVCYLIFQTAYRHNKYAVFTTIGIISNTGYYHFK